MSAKVIRLRVTTPPGVPVVSVEQPETDKGESREVDVCVACGEMVLWDEVQWVDGKSCCLPCCLHESIARTAAQKEIG